MSHSQAKAQKPSKKAKKAAARLAAAQVLYQMMHNGESALDSLRDFLDKRVNMEVEGETLVEPDTELLSTIVQGVEERKSDLSGIIKAQLEGKSRSNEMESLMKAVLFCGCYELLVHHDIDSGIIINDYLNVSHAFFEKSEVGLIHGVLDSAGKALRA